ncbi:MAG: GntR family transcriptional regulator [Paracoccaceae bacterium]|jgi:DNA-binding GntR family transcriptional regulator|nr:GntR family transcriptional regulator [Paracoccaceae bacterium]MDP7184788.1 GntR family transcriptional regulator [Paracoccaceae bacterium]
MPETAKDRKANLLADLRRDVLTMVLEPGSDLDEATLAETYGLSRTPLRDAFRELTGEGYLTLHQNRGARVTDMGHRTLRDFFLAAPMIYSSITQLAAENATPAQLDQLKDAQTAFKASLHSGNAADRTLANNRFHAITGEMAGNVYLQPSLNRLLIDHARISMTFYQPRNSAMAENVSLASEQHDGIIRAIEQGNGAKAAQLALDHWELSRGQIELFVMPTALDAPLGAAPGARTA